MGGEKERERERETEGAVRVSSSQPGRKSCHYEFSSLELLPGKERERERKREKEREREREQERAGVSSPLQGVRITARLVGTNLNTTETESDAPIHYLKILF
jgi:hypothetical protein